MDLYKPICKHIVVPLWAKYEKSPYLEHLKYLMESQYYDQEIIKKIQWKKIKNLLNHAYENVPFYRDKFRNYGIHPNDIKSIKDFANIKLLTKNEIRNNLEKLLAKNYKKFLYFITSGSTGIPIEGYRDEQCNEFKRACALRSNLWAGYDIGDRIYCIYGNPKNKYNVRTKLRRKLLIREKYLNSLELDDQSMQSFASLLQRKPPSLLWGHAHNMYIFAKFLEKKGIKDIRPKGMFSAGMVLHKWEKELTEKVFRCKLQDRYGCEELGLIAAECKRQEGMHINTDDLYIEFTKNDGTHAEIGSKGNIIITDLTNYIMPFIRYEIGDIGILSKEKCSCGRTQPLIKKILGREADFLITTEGKLISGISLTDNFGANISGVAQIQIIQEKIDLIILNIVKDDNFSDHSLIEIKLLVKEYFGNKMNFKCHFMNNIPQEPSGKYRFTICKIERKK